MKDVQMVATAAVWILFICIGVAVGFAYVGVTGHNATLAAVSGGTAVFLGVVAGQWMADYNEEFGS